MPKITSSPLKIAIIGGGFSGTAFAAACCRLSSIPLEITLFEKSGDFGTGKAYCTPFAHHLLNVRASEMSAYEDSPNDFVNWLHAHKEWSSNERVTLENQFVPRYLYGLYLKELLENMQKEAKSSVQLQLESKEVVDIIPEGNQHIIVTSDQQQKRVDKVILALGNSEPAQFSFPMTSSITVLNNPWEYQALSQVGRDDSILIVGTGLSMIDAVLTLYHQNHRGLIYALSRHGLLPLPHTSGLVDNIPFSLNQEISSLREMTRYLREISQNHIETGGDWRSVINALRPHIPALWANASLSDKKRFLRHVLPYWNIHRHRVHDKIDELLNTLKAQGQLQVIAGKILKADENKATIQLRHSRQLLEIKIQYIMNCMGPSLTIASKQPLLIKQLLQRGLASVDVLQLGLCVSPQGALQRSDGKVSSTLYTIGLLRRGNSWEVSAVPEIRKQCFDLARHLLAIA